MILLIPLVGSGRSNVFPAGAKATGMGNAFTSMDGIEAVFHNQAGFSSIDNFTVLLGYENRFGISELSQPYALVAIPTKSGNFGLHFSTLGPAQWLETNISLAYAKQITPWFSAGLQFNYFNNMLPEESSTISSAGFEAGVLFSLPKQIKIGAHVANPWSLTMQTRSYTEKIPWRVSAGAHMPVGNNVIVTAEAEKTEAMPVNLKAGLEWEAVPDLFFRIGANSSPATFFAGMGYSFSFVRADLAMCFHQQLGYTTGITLLFNIEW